MRAFKHYSIKRVISGANGKALLSMVLLCIGLIACKPEFNTTGFIVAEEGNKSNNFISSLNKDDFSFKAKYKNDPEYYRENELDSVRIFVFSMSYKGRDPLEYLAGNQQDFTDALERNAFNKQQSFGAISNQGDTIYPLLTSAPRTYGMDGQFTTLLSFHQSIETQQPIRLFYKDKAITAQPILFQFNH